jgi:cell division protein FtsI/penicillin-binding protein 2
MDMTPAQAKAISDSSLEGISAIDMRVRNSKNTLATHMIGYVDDKAEAGLSGIERAYQDTLKNGGGVYAGVIADAGDSFMSDFGYRIWNDMEEEKLNVKLTLDYHMQSIVEETMDRMVDKGAVVVLDILTGDVLAMASRPDFDPSNINPSLTDEDQALFNRALGAYTPGSIFKIVTASAALENGVSPDLTFDCPGYVELGDIIMKCSSYDSGGHGTVNMAQAFARSCNSYFINLGLKVGRDSLFDMAVRFGLGNKSGLSDQGIDEPSGELPSTFGYPVPAEIANLSIGQGSLLVSPVQAANMTAVIANGGLLNKVSIVDSIINDKGDRVRNTYFPSWERVLSKETAVSLQGMMLLSVQSGTGGLADIKGYGGSAGKTGSAETGWIKDNRNILHAWFSGYFPIDAPRYAMCIFIEDGKSGGSSAAPIFAEISAKIMDAGF